MRIFLFIAALAIATLNITNVKAMELAPVPSSIEQTTSAPETTPGVAPEKFFKTFALLQLQDRYFLPKDIYTHILHDLFFVYVLPEEISAYLKQNKNNPNEVIQLIGQSLKDYGNGISVSLLKMAFADAQMWIGDIKDSKLGNNCLELLCKKVDRNAHNLDLDCTEIILYVAGDKVYTLITLWDTCDGLSAWHYAIYCGHDDIVNLFIDHAVANNVIIELLAIKTGCKSTALHIAAFAGSAEVLKTLLAQAEKHGIVEELLDARDKWGDTVLDEAKKYKYAQIRDEMIATIEFYRTKNQLARMSLASNNQ